MKKYISGITLLELLIAISLLGLIGLTIFHIESFSRFQVKSVDKQTQLQNELTYALEHMSRYMLQGVSNSGQPPAEKLAGNNGFKVRVDPNYTPSNFTDDIWVDYTLTNNTLSCSLNNETLSRYIVSGVDYNPMPLNPASGFYIAFSYPGTNDTGAVVEIGLVARFNPAAAVSGDNPQVTMKTILYSRNASAR